MTRSLSLVAAVALAPSLLLLPSPERPAPAPKAQFLVRVTNVSTPATLKLSNGMTAPAPTSPVLWVIHTADNPIFTQGQPDRGMGLESLAEDGNPGKLAGSLKGEAGIVAVGTVSVPEGDLLAGPALPGKSFEFRVTAEPGQRLTLAMMFGQSNDLFYAPDGKGILLFDDGGKPMGGDHTAHLYLWDAGTEVNQEPGLGSDQGPRQKGANTGAAEYQPVDLVKDAFTYPAVSQVIRVTVTPIGAVSTK